MQVVVKTIAMLLLKMKCNKRNEIKVQIKLLRTQRQLDKALEDESHRC